MNSANYGLICSKKEDLLEILSKPYALPLKPIPSRSICSAFLGSSFFSLSSCFFISSDMSLYASFIDALWEEIMGDSVLEIFVIFMLLSIL